MKRWNFGGLRAIARRVGLASLDRFDRRPSGPGKTFKNKKSPASSVASALRRLNIKVVQTDVERGLILLEGRGAGAEGRLDHGARRREEGPRRRICRSPASSVRRSEPAAAPAQEGERVMDLKVTTLDGKEAGSVRSTRTSLALSRAPT
jgi:hypothetical protein